MAAKQSLLEEAIERFLASLRRANLSANTIRGYASDLKGFVTYFSPPGETPPSPADFEPLEIREFMADCYRRGNTNRSVARKLAALRAFFRFLVREGSAPSSPEIVDFVGYGSANFAEGAAAARLSNTTAITRAGGGCIDTDDNGSDFTRGAPSPRNTASPHSPCN